jgi:hypothetical protein
MNKPSVFAVVLPFVLLACSQSPHLAAPSANLVRSIDVTYAGQRPTVAPHGSKILDTHPQNPAPVAQPGTPAGLPVTGMVPTVNVTAVLDKAAILGTELLYGADLQYSSFYDKDMDLYNQSLAIGHIPAAFRIAGDELQLVADDRRLFPSAVNHPEQLLSRLKILSQTDTTITVSSLDSRVLLGEVFSGTHGDTDGTLLDATGPAPKDLWVRSFEYASQGAYILQQTSVVLPDGSIAEFMESVFPRANLTPGAAFLPIQLDPSTPSGGSDGDAKSIASRFRFLPGEQIFQIAADGSETKLEMAQHFDLSNNATLDYYVTPNISDEDLAPVKLAVEGWNRYFSKYQGLQRNVMRFMGRLPDGIHIGDPRFNVINWDSRLIAGAAYESQASDPYTGRQSHSLIYMPAAWLKIGTDYWQNGQYSDATTTTESTAGLKGALRTARVACLRDMREPAALLASGKYSGGDVAVFGKELLKQTLFHEVGHSLGLAHNFKGSLSYDPSKPGSMFSTSIMDYNDFEIERGAFAAVDTSDGPALEYDRQAIDAIYDQSHDIAAADPVVPTCNDAEADSEDDGVDPLCMRYDIQHDPTLAVNTAFDRVNLAQLAGDVTLAQALSHVPGAVLGADRLAAVKTVDDANALVGKLRSAFSGSIGYFHVSGKASISRVVRNGLKYLLAFEDGILPDGYDERAMRERAFAGVQKAISATALSDAATAGLSAAIDAAAAQLAQTPYAAGLAAPAQADFLAGARKTLAGVAGDFISGGSPGLPALRTAVLTALARHPAVPFFFGIPEGDSADTGRLDYESAIVGILGDAAVNTALSLGERTAAATSLMSFQGREQGDPAIVSARAKITTELQSAGDNKSREAAEALLAVLAKAQ